MTDGTTNVVPGTIDTYTIVVTNNGPDAVVTVTDTVPAALLNPFFTGAGFVQVGPDLWEGILPGLASGATVTFTLTGTIDPNATGPITNTVTADPPAGTTDPIPGNNTASDTDTMPADLQVIMTGPASAVPGTGTTYTFTVSNNGPSAVSSLTLTDASTPALLNPTFGSPSAGSYDPLTGVWSGLSLASGDVVTLTLTGTIDPNATGVLTNTVTVAPPAGTTDTNPGNDTFSFTNTLTPEADLAVTLTSPINAVPGTSTTYTFTVTNTGPSTVSTLTLTDSSLPVLLNRAFTTPEGSYDPLTGVWSGLSLASGDVVTLTLTGTIDPNATGPITNTVTVAPPAGTTDTNPGNDTVSFTNTLTPVADLAVTITDGKTTVAAGTPNTYTITATNNGPSTAVAAAVTDTFPADLTSVSWTAVASPGSSVSATSGVGNINTPVTLLPGGTATFTARGLGVAGRRLRGRSCARIDGERRLKLTAGAGNGGFRRRQRCGRRIEYSASQRRRITADLSDATARVRLSSSLDRLAGADEERRRTTLRGRG
jgi:uncharacterized repeat protein (TIGR01451 family)